MARRMSAESFKFDWMRAVCRERWFTGDTAIVLLWIALINVKRGEDWFQVRQRTVADNLGVSTRTVIRAFAQGRELGYLELIEERERGKWGKSNAYALVIPKPQGDSAVTYSAQVGDSPDQSRGQPCPKVGDKPCNESAPLPAEIDSPWGLSLGYKSGVLKDTGACASAPAVNDPSNWLQGEANTDFSALYGNEKKRTEEERDSHGSV
jgi:hypothetical protein